MNARAETNSFSAIREIRGQKRAAVVAAFFVLTLFTALARADALPEILPPKQPQQVFAGGARTVSVLWRNGRDQTASLALSTRLYQASSATAAPLGETVWKELEILPRQTVLESLTLHLPAVKAETRFLVQWLRGSNNVLGITEVWGYPTNILRELGVLAGGAPVGVYDPQNQLKPLLRTVGVDFSDLEDQSLERFSGKLVIVGPFESKAQMRESLPGSIRLVARKGAGVVWILPPMESHGEITPSFYTVFEGKGTVVVVQAGVIADLPDNPQAQLDLVQLCRRAVKPEPVQLPFLASQP